MERDDRDEDDEAAGAVAASEVWCFGAFLAIIAIGLVWLWLDQQIYSNLNDLVRRGQTPPVAGGDLPQSKSTVGVGGPIPPRAKFETSTPAGVDETPRWVPELREFFPSVQETPEPAPTVIITPAQTNAQLPTLTKHRLHWRLFKPVPFIDLMPQISQYPYIPGRMSGTLD